MLMLMARTNAKELALRALALSNADGCEIALNGYLERNIRLVSHGNATNGTTAGARVRITSKLGKRDGHVSADALDRNALRDIVVRSEQAARSAPENAESMPPLGRQNYPSNRAYFETTAALTANDLADLLAPAARLGRRSGVEIAAFVQ